jgi:hypothetical protein
MYDDNDDEDFDDDNIIDGDYGDDYMGLWSFIYLEWFIK